MKNLLIIIKEWTEVLLFLLSIVALIILMMLSALPAEAHTKTQIKSMIVEATRYYKIDPRLALAIAEVESGFDPNAVGGLGERGVFQLRPEFHKYVVGDTRRNIYTAVAYLVEVRKLCEPKYGKAWLIGYNLGPHYPKRIRFPALFPYYLKVRAAMNARLASNQGE